MSAALRTYRLPEWGNAGQRTVVTQWQRNTCATPVGFVSAAELAAQAKQAPPPTCTHKRPGRPRETPGLDEMAAVYNEHLHSGKPTQAVREQFPHWGTRTIDRHIQRARQQGLITAPAPRGGRPRRNPGA